MKETKEYKNFEEFEEAFDNIPEEIIKRETYDLLKLYNQTHQQLQSYKQKEDKLREYCNNKTIKTNLPLYTKEVIAESKIANDVLEILKGDK